MKLTIDKLSFQLNKALATCYLITGDEPLLVREAREQIVHACKQQDYNEHCHFYPDDTPWNKLPSLAANRSLFSQKQIIDIRLNKPSVGRDGGKIIADLLATPLQDTVIILSCPRLDSSAQRSKWVKSFEQQGVLIQIWPIAPAQLPNWIKNRAKQSGFTLAADALSLLCEFSEGNLLAATQALDKLPLVTDEKNITLACLQEVMTDNSHFDIFAWTEACVEGSQARQAKILQRLQDEGVEPILILWAIAREIKLLMSLHQQKVNGTPLNSLWSKHRVFGNKQTVIARLLQALQPEFWPRFMPAIADIDRIIKGAKPGNAWYALQNVGASLALRKQLMD